jgi:tRNA threonylcarbamoyl adenosine modification protein (Sua5/YciO/YrdC/YwlC family)
MIEYIIAHSPDDSVIDNACEILRKGGLVCLPTDTNWILIADPTHKDGLEKLYKIKKENGNKHFSLFVPDISTASEVAMIDDQAFKILKKITPGHYTFIFEAKKRIAKSIKATKTDKEIGLRFVPSVLVETLLKAYKDVVISTNIPTSSIPGLVEDDEIYSYMIEDSSIKHMIDLIIDPGEIEFAGQSSIISFLGDIPEVVREGVGDVSIFN